VPEYRYREKSLYRKIGTMARQPKLPLQVRFGLRVRRLREAQGWSFTYLAVHSGIAKSTLLEIEKGRADVRLSTTAALAGSFGKTVSELLRGM
jgi:DNA-binding XRE family transcriptional regulator